MVTHIVLWKLKDRESLSAVEAELSSLRDRVPGIEQLAVGMPPSPDGPMADISLYTEFTSWEDLKAYQVHPEHQKVVAFLKPLVAERHVSDYES
ncbi:MAG: Dabb family protein [Kiritimatiellia bacterium]